MDAVTDPLGAILPERARSAASGVKAAEFVGDRGEYGDVIDGVLYESSDSYAQTRLTYLQRRRFELGMEDPSAAEIDPLALDTEGF